MKVVKYANNQESKALGLGLLRKHPSRAFFDGVLNHSIL